MLFRQLPLLAAVLSGLAGLATATPLPEEQQQQQDQGQGLQSAQEVQRAQEEAALGRSNDWSCRSSKHPNPVVLVHALFGSDKIGLNFLEGWLRKRGFCTFAPFYGSYVPFLPVLGGLKPIAQSSAEVADFVREVRRRTGAAKVDLVGHSEGGFQSLYVPKFYPDVAAGVDRIVAIAPPTHGTTLLGLQRLLNLLGLVGCAACSDFTTDSPAVARLNDGRPIVQPGNRLTVVASRLDEVVTPPSSSFVDEPAVQNIFVQDYCPIDLAGHLGENIDRNVWNLVLNALEDQHGRKFPCLGGPPGR
ncbi:hypothetical protein CDD83_24 [Cordyceps sp. RAO-2017]|nr:hypothetical protein CDD83_24 [Cordyceps sp. RAO-2017]